MTKDTNALNDRALNWLYEFSRNMECDPENVEDLSDEGVREELRVLGADVEGFHTRLNAALRAAKVKQAGEALVQWLSPLWQPQWSGQFVGAGDIPRQTHLFELAHGSVEISCSWKARQGNTPAYLDFSWKADILQEGRLCCRFVHADTQELLAEIPLGESKEGGHYLTSRDLGFDPSLEKWALGMLVKR